jgi:hypothetical protein
VQQLVQLNTRRNNKTKTRVKTSKCNKIYILKYSRAHGKPYYVKTNDTNDSSASYNKPDDNCPLFKLSNDKKTLIPLNEAAKKLDQEQRQQDWNKQGQQGQQGQQGWNQQGQQGWDQQGQQGWDQQGQQGWDQQQGQTNQGQINQGQANQGQANQGQTNQQNGQSKETNKSTNLAVTVKTNHSKQKFFLKVNPTQVAGKSRYKKTWRNKNKSRKNKSRKNKSRKNKLRTHKKYRGGYIEDWKETISRSTGLPYYIHTPTGISSWTIPADEISRYVPQTSRTTGKQYWLNYKTGNTSWRLPGKEMPRYVRQNSKTTGKQYWLNTAKNKSSWDLPVSSHLTNNQLEQYTGINENANNSS